MKFPRCYLCWHNSGVRTDAAYLAAASSNEGKTIVWRTICEDHRKGWNEEGEWDAPVYPLAPPGVDPRFNEAALKNACETLADVLAPLFGCDREGLKVVTWQLGAGGVRIAELSYSTGNAGWSYMRCDARYDAKRRKRPLHASSAALFLACEEFLVGLLLSGNEAEIESDARQAVIDWFARAKKDEK